MIMPLARRQVDPSTGPRKNIPSFEVVERMLKLVADGLGVDLEDDETLWLMASVYVQALLGFRNDGAAEFEYGGDWFIAAGVQFEVDFSRRYLIYSLRTDGPKPYITIGIFDLSIGLEEPVMRVEADEDGKLAIIISDDTPLHVIRQIDPPKNSLPGSKVKFQSSHPAAMGLVELSAISAFLQLTELLEMLSDRLKLNTYYKP